MAIVSLSLILMASLYRIGQQGRFQRLSKNGLYPFPLFAFASPSSGSTSIAFLGVKTTVGTKHQHLDHPIGSAFHKILTSLPFSGTASTPFCKYCQVAKSSKLENPALTQAKVPLTRSLVNFKQHVINLIIYPKLD